MKDATLWIWGGTALIPSRPKGTLEDSAIGIAGGKIVFVGTRAEAKPTSSAKKIDASGCLVSPGIVNGHTHVGMSMLRGVADDLPLQTWLHERIFPLEKKYANAEFVYWGTLLAACEMIRSGTTCFNDMYYLEESAARGANEAGLRMVAGLDFGGNEIEPVFDKYLETISGYPLVTPTMAPHAIYTVPLEKWKRVVAYRDKHRLGIHFHLSETQGEVDETKKKYGKTPVEFFTELGLWNGRVTAAHSVCLTEKDIQTLGKYKVGISHNPESNMKLGTLVAPVVELRRAGCPVAIGTDSTASNNNLDMLTEADFCAKLQSFKYGAGALSAGEVFSMLTSEGAKAVGATGCGAIEVGQAADLIAVEVSAPHAVPLYNAYSHLVYSACGRDVRHTVVNGQVLLENRNLQTLDEQEILREAVSWARRIMA